MASEQDKRKQRTKALILLASVAAIAGTTFVCTVLVAQRYGAWNGVIDFLNGGKPFRTRTLLLGMMSAMVFGFIDNAGLFFGMDALDPYLPQDGELTKAGWGNTFSDGIGAFLGAFVGKMIEITTGFDGGPIYGDFVGIVIGCILGIYIPRGITGKK